MRKESELRSFCIDLSSSEPSPGGGTAAAAAGSMAASLVVMVCGITAKNKKHASNKPELDSIGESMSALRDELVGLASEDARAYDKVVEAARELKAKGLGEPADVYERALKNAAEVPLRTVEACVKVLEASVRVSEIGLRSARSDVGVAALLAKAGLKGAYMNVVINLEGVSDGDFARLKRERLNELLTQGDRLSKRVLKKINLG
ncbi:MAG TPA: cyclodeaminase/cyclohydrolase family protein [Thermoplasmata archaeon]